MSKPCCEVVKFTMKLLHMLLLQECCDLGTLKAFLVRDDVLSTYQLAEFHYELAYVLCCRSTATSARWNVYCIIALQLIIIDEIIAVACAAAAGVL
jgi:hypothetical protein